MESNGQTDRLNDASDDSEDLSVFISYRRQFGSYEARSVYQHLVTKNFDVFLDVEDIDSGRFESIVLNRLGQCRHFILILTPDTITGMMQPNDWVRREAERALELGKNVVPLLFGTTTVAHLSSSDAVLTRLSQLNALEVPARYFDAAMEQLVSRFLKQPTLQELEVKTAEEHFEAAEGARAKGDNNLALKEYTEAIRRNSRSPDYFGNRSAVNFQLGRYNEALDDINQALALDPTSQQLATNKFYILQEMGDLSAALDWMKNWGIRTGTWQHDLPVE